MDLVVGCLSACEKFQTDEYCCRGMILKLFKQLNSNRNLNY